jgi:general stress protein 26
MSERKLRELIEGISVAMMTTVDQDGQLRSRPLMTLEVDSDEELWFFTAIDSPKIDEIGRDNRVNLSYSDPDGQDYVSISGQAEIVRDRSKIRQLWRPAHKAWFPDGVDDPQLALIRVDASKAEYWDAPGSAAITLVGMAKAIATGQPYRAGEHEKLRIG